MHQLLESTGKHVVSDLQYPQPGRTQCIFMSYDTSKRLLATLQYPQPGPTQCITGNGDALIAPNSPAVTSNPSNPMPLPVGVFACHYSRNLAVPSTGSNPMHHRRSVRQSAKNGNLQYPQPGRTQCI